VNNVAVTQTILMSFIHRINPTQFQNLVDMDIPISIISLFEYSSKVVDTIEQLQAFKQKLILASPINIITGVLSVSSIYEVNDNFKFYAFETTGFCTLMNLPKFAVMNIQQEKTYEEIKSDLNFSINNFKSLISSLVKNQVDSKIQFSQLKQVLQLQSEEKLDLIYFQHYIPDKGKFNLFKNDFGLFCVPVEQSFALSNTFLFN
jgi:hypothetical protein